jgi:hypothetical protein
LKKSSDPVGYFNDEFIRKVCYLSRQVVLCWGTHGAYQDRGAEVIDNLQRWLPQQQREKFYHFGLTKHGHPKHPLYLKADQELLQFPLPEKGMWCD